MGAILAPPSEGDPTVFDPTPSPDGVVELDARGRLLRFNRRLLEIYGLPEEQISELLELRDRGPLQERLIAALSERAIDQETFRAGARRQLSTPLEVTFEDIPLRDGRIVERYGTPVCGRHGEPRGRLFTIRDVSERRRGEIELRERARQQEAVAIIGELALNAPSVSSLLPSAAHLAASALSADCVHVLALSQDGTRLEQRCSAGRMAALDASVPFQPSESSAAHAISIGATVVTANGECEHRFRSFGDEALRSGVSAVVRGRTAPFGALCAHWRSPRTPSVDEVHFLETVANMLSAAIARDEAERALVERERELRAVFEATQDGLVTVDDAGHVVSCNPAAGGALGLPPSAVSGHPLLSLLSGAEASEGERTWRALLESGRGSGRAEVRPGGGPPRTVEWSGTARILPGLHLVVLRDVTEHREMLARLALADRMVSVGTLAAGVAHELNNPLAYVAANVSYALERLGGGETREAPVDVREALEEAREGTGRMRDIVRDLRTFSRADESPVGPVDLRPVLESCISMAWNEIKHRARLTRELSDLPRCRGTEARLAQVFLNLVVNAAQAIPVGAAEENEIRIGSRLAPDGRIAVEVRDSGCGIRPEILPRIFDPFFTTKSPGEGTGLGLSICHRIVADLGGAIEVESEPGRGTTFRVLLPPCGEPLPSTTRAPEPGPPARRRARVLVVDDEPFVGTAVQRALSGEHEVTILPSAREALDLISRGVAFDAIVTDLLMPDMTGMDLFREVAERDGTLAERMLFTTGGAFTAAAREFVALHSGRCLEKPFDLEALRAAIRRRLSAAPA